VSIGDSHATDEGRGRVAEPLSSVYTKIIRKGSGFMKIKWKNYGLWAALGSLVVMAVTDLSNVAPEDVQAYVNIGLGILVAAGVISNPSLGKGFADKNEKDGDE
jgi:hypothetical protein